MVFPTGLVWLVRYNPPTPYLGHQKPHGRISLDPGLKPHRGTRPDCYIGACPLLKPTHGQFLLGNPTSCIAYFTTQRGRPKSQAGGFAQLRLLCTNVTSMRNCLQGGGGAPMHRNPMTKRAPLTGPAHRFVLDELVDAKTTTACLQIGEYAPRLYTGHANWLRVALASHPLLAHYYTQSAPKSAHGGKSLGLPKQGHMLRPKEVFAIREHTSDTCTDSCLVQIWRLLCSYTAWVLVPLEMNCFVEIGHEAD